MRRITLIVAAFVLFVGAFWPGVAPVSADTGSNWTGEYFNNRYLSGTAIFVRLDSAIAFDWGGGSPVPGIVPADNFSVRWTGPQSFASGGTYRFTATTDDGVRVYVDDRLVIDAWRDQLRTTVTGDITLTAGQHWVRVEYYEAGDQAVIYVSWALAGAQTASGGWAAEYYNNTTLTAPQAGGRLEQSVDYNWGLGSPIPGVVNADNFSARWWGFPQLEAGTYTFVAGADDGVRVWADGTLVVDNWNAGIYRETRGDIYLSAGQHTIRVEYFELSGNAQISVYWFRQATATAVPPTQAVQGLFARANVTVRVRSGPGTNYSRVGALPGGQSAQVIGRNPDSSWLEVTLSGGGRGWISAAYVTLVGTTPLSSIPITIGVPSSPTTPPVTAACPGTLPSRLTVGGRGRVTPGDPNNLRIQPTTSSVAIGLIPAGGTFTVLAGPVCANGFAWWQVNYNGLVGWTPEAGGVYWLEPAY
jgi:uncharacterized protein YraI